MGEHVTTILFIGTRSCLGGENFAVSCKGGSFVYQDLFLQCMHCFKTKYAGCAEIILSRINGVHWRRRFCSLSLS